MDRSFSTQKFGRLLRKNSTIYEKRLWEAIRNRQFRNLKFRRQHPIGSAFFVDFFCPELKITIELDGSVHDDRVNTEYDKERDSAIKELGLKVFRIKNSDLPKEPQDIYDYLENLLK